MGAKIKGAGSSQIEIEGVKQLKDVSYNIMSDRIEAGTFLCIAAMNHSNIIVKNIDEDHIIPIIDKLEEAGCELQIEDRQIQIKATKKLKSVNIKTMPYPGFPTDMHLWHDNENIRQTLCQSKEKAYLCARCYEIAA